MPPNGAVRSRTRKALTQVVPARSARPTRSARAADRVQTIAESPYSVELASSTRLGLVGEGLEGQHRAEDLSLDDLGVVRGGLDQGRLVEESAEPADLGAAPAADDPVAALAGALDEALDAGEVVGVDQRRDRRLRVARIAEHVAVDRSVEALEEGARRPAPRPATGSRRGTPGRSRRTSSRRALAASSRSASSKTSSGPLPPSSPVNGTRLPAAARADRPARPRASR